MNRHIPYAVSTVKSALFLTVLGCALSAGLAGAIFQPASAARATAKGVGGQPVPASQDYGAQAQEARSVQPQLALQQAEQLQFTPLEGGSAIEMRDGKVVCRVATEEEARLMRRDPGQQLLALEDETIAAETQKGLKIILRGTPQLEKFPEAKAAFLRAARTWESMIQNPITVVVDVDFGPTSFGKPFEEYRIANTSFQRIFVANGYSIIRAALISSAGSPREAALYKSLPQTQLPTDLGPAPGMIFQIAALRALGVYQATANPDAEREALGSPPGIAFNSAQPWDFDPSDGVKPKRADFTALALHEIGHSLGFFSGVGIREMYPDVPVTPESLDLFRFRPGVSAGTFSTAERILSSGGEHIFFDGESELPLSTGRLDYTGGDGRQAGHWKDHNLTERYIGVMNPVFLEGLHYEMTADDLKAFELIGYRMNPLLSKQEAELKLDDGGTDNGAIGNGLIVINRLTPPSYPATLRKLRIVIPILQNQPNPAGQPITLIYAPSGPNGELPLSSQFTRFETTVPSGNTALFLEFPIPNGPTIKSGVFYVGYQTPSPHQGVGFAADLSGATESRSFYSINNGASFAPFSEIYQGKPANALIRAVISNPAPPPAPTPVPTPTPSPGPATIALKAGALENGRMTRSSPTGSVFETQYTIEVPNDATQLKIDLNASADMDLYARFGSRIVVQAGAVVADFKSVSDAGREQVTITPDGSPALKAGIYYIFLVNYGPGAADFSITATVTSKSDPAPGQVVSVSAADFKGGELAADQIAAAFGSKLATTMKLATEGSPECRRCLPTELAGTRVLVTDSAGTQRRAGLFFVSPNQVNYHIPRDTAVGTATVTITSGDGAVSVGKEQIVKVSPGLFTANSDGQGAPAADLARVTKGKGGEDKLLFEPATQFDSAQKRIVPRPIDLGPETDKVFLILYGTGVRRRQSLSTVSVKIGGVESSVLFADAIFDFVGLDQINVELPRKLIGRGEVDVTLLVDGKPSNTVKVNFK